MEQVRQRAMDLVIDTWIQPVSIPEVDHTLVSKNNEILFELIDPDGTRCLEQCEGNVISVPKAEGGKHNTATVIWNEKRIIGREYETSNLILMPSLWNPKTKSKIKNRAWQFYYDEKKFT